MPWCVFALPFRFHFNSPLSRNVYIIGFTSPWSNANKAFLHHPLLHPQHPMADTEPQLELNYLPRNFFPRSTSYPQHDHHAPHNVQVSVLTNLLFFQALMYLYMMLLRSLPLPAVANSKEGGRMCYLRRPSRTMLCKAHCRTHSKST